MPIWGCFGFDRVMKVISYAGRCALSTKLKINDTEIVTFHPALANILSRIAA